MRRNTLQSARRFRRHWYRLQAAVRLVPARILSQLSRLKFLALQLKIIFTHAELRSKDGLRFLEISYLLTQWLRQRIEVSPDIARKICEQFSAVLKSCDEITYDEEGAAEAYVILHFLDRYHRFQMIFSELSRLKIMPRVEKPVVLDIGTGPGPSMFAVSDFYKSSIWKLNRLPYNLEEHISIDYAERSAGFRNWLHHFTELANYWAPSRVPWAVPYHHGSTYDFSDLSFDRVKTYYDYNDDGEAVYSSVVEKVRPNIIIMSNFLTTKEQAEGVKDEIRNCARHLRNRGLLIVVGARSISPKYKPVYDIIDQAILGVGYSRKKYIARCEAVNLPQPIFNYNYDDAWGKVLKQFLKDTHEIIVEALGEEAPKKVLADLQEWSSPNYSHSLQWEVRVYRKRAFSRDQAKRAKAV